MKKTKRTELDKAIDGELFSVEETMMNAWESEFVASEIISEIRREGHVCCSK